MSQSPPFVRPVFPEGVELKALTRQHALAIFQIEKTVYPEPWSLDLLEESLIAPMTFALGLFKLDRLLAYGIYQVVLSEGHLLNLAVDQEFQRQSLGGALLDCILFDSQKRGASSFFLEVRVDNEAARKLYEKRGFQGLMIREKYYKDGQSALIMVKTGLESGRH